MPPYSPEQVFREQLQQALRNYRHAGWLGERSPLATPYFLGRSLQQARQPDTPAGRGQALQQALRRAATELWGGPLPEHRDSLAAQALAHREEQGIESPRYHYLLLELAYSRHFFAPGQFPDLTDHIADFVLAGRSRYYAHLMAARERLGELLLGDLQPTFRLEQPALHTALIGRERVLESCLRELRAGQSVAVSGMGGIGKTTLGVAIRQAWPNAVVFWYTFRSGAADQLAGVLFSLAHFCRQHGQAGLWLQLLANRGDIGDLSQAVGILRHDLQALRALSPLLCFDEVDMLRPAADEKPDETLRQLLESLESLHGLAPILYLGQRIPLDTATHHVLAGLEASGVVTLFQGAGYVLSSKDAARLANYTQGNPRLLELCLALYGDAGNVDSLLEQLPAAPAVQPLFDRLWRRLEPSERHLLQMLAVFRGVAPADPWQQEQAALQGLLGRHLLQEDDAGGLFLSPMVRQMIDAETPRPAKDQHQLRAAEIRAARGEYTEAVYHCAQAGQSETAIGLWDAYQDLEIRRGQASAARLVFQQISFAGLPDASQRKLKLIRNRLDLLAGDARSVLADMDRIDWLPDAEETVDAYTQAGRAAAILGDSRAALKHYDHGIETIARLLRKLISLRYRRGGVYLSLGDADGLRHEARRARYEVEYLQGLAEDHFANYERAEEHLLLALALGRLLQDDDQVARTLGFLSTVACRQGKIAEAQAYTEQAVQLYLRRGDVLGAESARAEFGGMLLQGGDYGGVIRHLEPALSFFEGVQSRGWVATISSNLAEAYFWLGQLDNARTYALRALQNDVPHVSPYALFTLGLVYQRQGELAAAESSLQDGLDAAQRNEDRFVEAYLRRVLGEVYQAQGESRRAEVELRAALAFFEQAKLTKEAAETREILGRLQAREGPIAWPQ